MNSHHVKHKPANQCPDFQTIKIWTLPETLKEKNNSKLLSVDGRQMNIDVILIVVDEKNRESSAVNQLN